MPFPPVNPALARALAARDYDEPTPVQTAVLAPEAEGRDLLVSAQTGSGKTVAFGLALAPTLLRDEERFGPAGAPLALVIAPTRELAMQVKAELSWLYGQTGARIASCVGGMDVRAEQRALASGCHIVVGTPGRLRDHLERGRLDLGQIRAAVLDEADEMLDMGFRDDLEFILDATPPTRRTLLFSATIPKEIAALARSYQRDSLRIDVGGRNEPHGDIEYRAVLVSPHDAERAAVNVLRYFEARAALVFCATREGVRRLHGRLLERGFDVVALSGELSQQERNRALQSLRDGHSRVCVATDVAARGLDLPELDLVIHADLPTNKETMLHRSGRTGRAGRLERPALRGADPGARPGPAARRPTAHRGPGRGGARTRPEAARQFDARTGRGRACPALAGQAAGTGGEFRPGTDPTRAHRGAARRGRLVPLGGGPAQQRRPEMADPADLPPGRDHQGGDRGHPHLRARDAVRGRGGGGRAVGAGGPAQRVA